MKKALSILLTLCLLLGMASLVASATGSDTDTVYLYMSSANSLNISSTGYTIIQTDNSYKTVEFTGKYVLAGSVKRGVHFTESGTYDVTLHNLDATSTNWCSSFSFDAKNVTLNLTAVGVNKLIGHNHPGFTTNVSLSDDEIANGNSCGIIKLAVAENSSILFNSSMNKTSVSVNSAITFTMADGSDVPGTDVDGWNDSALTVSNGTPAAHTVTPTGTDHKYICSDCDIEFAAIEGCSEFTYIYVDENYCQKTCTGCGKKFETEEHDYECHSNGDANGHIMECVYCGDKKTIPHTYYYGYKHHIDSEHCAKECDVCAYYDESTAALHNYNLYEEYDSTYCVARCACGYYDSDNPILQEHSYKCYPNDDETHNPFCEYCYRYDSDTGTLPHKFDDGTPVEATKENGTSTNYTCEDCGYERLVPDNTESIVFEVSCGSYACWHGSAIVVYVDGVPTRTITNRGNIKTETHSMVYNADSSYVFKWIRGEDSEDCAAKIYFPGSDEPVAEWDYGEMKDFYSYKTIYSVNCADYTAVDAALEKIPDFLEYYSAESVEKLVTAVKGVRRMLPTSKQNDVDNMAAAVETAVSGLVELDSPVPNGVINLSNGYLTDINDEGEAGYLYFYDDSFAIVFDYSGKYTLLGTAGDDAIVDTSIYVYDGNVEIDVVNAYIYDYYPCLYARNSSDVTLNLYGTSAFIGIGASGIAVNEDASLTINDGDGSILAVGSGDSAGIGGYYFDYEVGSCENCGTVNIKGSTVVALSIWDGAGIGGAYEGSAGKITIDGGVIHAENLFGDGAGIGCGGDGNGGDITINGGDIVALCVYEDGDGAGIGGADDGSIDTITINGGKIIAGSTYGAAIGGGYDSDYCGKITVNGGVLSESIYHSSYHCFIGHSYYNDVYIVSEKSSVQINGGIISENTNNGINPAPTNKDGKAVKALEVELEEKFIGEDIIITLSDGTKIEANSEETTFAVYAPEGTTVSEIKLASDSDPTDPTDPTEPSDDDDDMFWLWKFFLSIFEWFGSVFQKIGSFFAGLFA